tara:strand:+ start:501 stop:974 length:474 start_codon:yes stop_codon:yes gene_type:complete
MAKHSSDFHGKKVYKIKQIVHKTILVEANNEEDALELVDKGKMVLLENYYTPSGRRTYKVKAKSLAHGLNGNKLVKKPARVLSSALTKREQSKRIERAKNRVMSQIPCKNCDMIRSEHDYARWSEYWYCTTDLGEYSPTHSYAEWQAKHGKEVLTHG